MSTLAKTRNPFYDVFKGLLMLFVVIGHGVEILYHFCGGFNTVIGNATYLFFYLFHMPAFIFMLGFLSKSVAKSSRKILSRLLFFFAIYVLCKTFYYLGLARVFGEMPVWATLSLWQENSVPWFMLTATLLTPTLWIARKVPGWILLPLTFALGLYSGSFVTSDGFMSLSRTLIFLPIFLLGFYFPTKPFDWLTAKKRSWCWLSLLVMGVVWFLCYKFATPDGAMYKATQLVWGGEQRGVMSILYGETSFADLGRDLQGGMIMRATVYGYALAGIVVLSLLAAALSHENPRFIERLGRNSLAPYMMHYPTMLFVFTMLRTNASIAGTNTVISIPLFALVIAFVLWFWSQDGWEDILRLIQKGLYAFFGLFIPEKKAEPAVEAPAEAAEEVPATVEAAE